MIGEVSSVDSFSVSVVATIKGENQKWMVTGVYGPTRGDLLESFIEELERIKGRWNLPWCIGGDFNEIIFLEERNRATRRTRGMDLFCDFVDRNELIDVQMSGVRFTWSNFQERPALSKLDRFLISTNWDDYFSTVSVYVLPRPGSNHSPILLKGGEEIRKQGLFPFRFQNIWLMQPGFEELVRGQWKEMEFWGAPG